MLGMAPGKGNSIHSLPLPLHCASEPLTLSTCGVMTSELRPKMRLTERSKRKAELMAEALDGVEKCQLLLAPLPPVSGTSRHIQLAA